MNINIEKGFKKCDYESLPKISSEILFAYVTKLSEQGTKIQQSAKSKDINEAEYKVDYVQCKKTKFNTELKGIYYQPLITSEEKSTEDAAKDSNANEQLKYKIHLNFNETKNEITYLKCDKCEQEKEKGICSHALAFLFWVHNKVTNYSADPKEVFWPEDKKPEEETIKLTEVEEEAIEPSPATQMKNIFLIDETLLDGCEEFDELTEEDGHILLNNILDEMEKVGINDSAFYKHCRPLTDEFESVYVHHTMLDHANNYVKDFKTFINHMENQGHLFDKLSDVSVNQYRKGLWAEAQYGRIRCSLMHRISSHVDASEDNAILNAILCQNREWNSEERKNLKEHKRFILKQAEKLENKVYKKCGLLLSENYPYLCATPDGITDDHIVEIKAPKSDEEFEKYLVGKETIAPKYMAQIQIQMYLGNVSKALYCVLSPSFDTNGALHYVWVQADMEMVSSLLGAAEDYWKDIVFPRLCKIYNVEE